MVITLLELLKPHGRGLASLTILLYFPTPSASRKLPCTIFVHHSLGEPLPLREARRTASKKSAGEVLFLGS